MSKPRNPWWEGLKKICRLYPERCVELSVLQNQSCVQSYTGMPGNGEAQRTTENYALRGFTGRKGREFDAVTKAIETTKKLPYTGNERVRLVSMVFFAKTHTLEGAAGECHISYRTACQWHGDFLREVGKNMKLGDD